METIAQEAKRLLEPIPDKQWITGEYSDGNSRCCMIGHWNERHGLPSDDARQSLPFNIHILKFLETKGIRNAPYEINDGLCRDYSQSTPKQRVMALLDDMIKAGY